MYVVYHGRGKNIAGSLAAAIHINIFSLTDIKNHNFKPDFFYKKEKEALCNLLFFGEDNENNKVFMLNTGKFKTLILNSIQSVSEILQKDTNQIFIADVHSAVSSSESLGFYIYSGPFRRFAPYFEYKELLSNYSKAADLVNSTKIYINNLSK